MIGVLEINNPSAGRWDLEASGGWTAENAATLDGLISAFLAGLDRGARVDLDLSKVSTFDTYGALMVARLAREAGAKGAAVDARGLPERFSRLADRVALVGPSSAGAGDGWSVDAMFRHLNSALAGAARESLELLAMLGAIGQSLATAIVKPSTLRLVSVVHHLDRVAWQALPIIVLITLLIGGIVAQQGFFHFRKFGAEQYVVDMVGVLVLREIGVLLVAIMVAGRSGSSYTAELGTMKMREEIDALKTMGRDPVTVLILPRVLALVMALPALAFIGMLSALVGGMLMAWAYGDMSPYIFVARLHEAISTTHFKVGMVKAPFMALIIGVVACVEGLRVEGSAESLGLRTTASVVKAIFLVIVLDGAFAMYFAAIGM